MSDLLTTSSEHDGRIFQNENPDTYPVQLADELLESLPIALHAATSGTRSHRALSGKVTIMPIGDSITYGVIDSHSKTQTGGYRTYLWQALTDNGYRVNFVGTEANGPQSIDRHHAGYRGKTIEQIADLVNDQMIKQKPDVVLLLAGTNDILQDRDLDNALQRLSRFIDQILETSPKTTVLVGTLPPNTRSDNNPAQIRDFNLALAEVVDRQRRQDKNVERVDLYNRLTRTDLQDQTHPTARGYKKIAQAWFEKLTDVLDGQNDTNSSASTDHPGDPITGHLFTFSGATKNQALRSSTLVGNHYDRLINFNPRQGDRIQLDFDHNLATTGRQERPNRLFNAGIQIESTLNQAVEAAYADVNPHQKGDQRLKPNQAAIFQYKKRFYLTVNNHKPAFQANGDLFVDLGQITRANFAPGDFHASSLAVPDYFI